MFDQSNVIYLYDGSFDGFLCCVFESFSRRETPAEIFYSDASPSFFETREIETDAVKAGRVYRSLEPKLGLAAVELCEDCFLADIPQKELMILCFLQFAFSCGKSAAFNISHPLVNPLIKTQRNVRNESHLMKEFLRFSDYGGILAAQIEPKNYVLPRIAPHFTARFPCEQILIYDKTHGMAFVYKDRKGQIMPTENLEFPKADETELFYRSLWRQFYKTVEIKARHNERCRMTHMPKRFWGCMTEFLSDIPELSSSYTPRELKSDLPKENNALTIPSRYLPDEKLLHD